MTEKQLMKTIKRLTAQEARQAVAEFVIDQKFRGEPKVVVIAGPIPDWFDNFWSAILKR